MNDSLSTCEIVGIKRVVKATLPSQEVCAVDISVLVKIAWDDLLVGDDDGAGKLKLVDQFENQLGSDAVYVDLLVVGADSSLDLNGINLYYREADIAGQVIASGGGTLYAVPEPTMLGLLLLATASFVVGAGKCAPCRS